jgi:hypothetical protein
MVDETLLDREYQEMVLDDLREGKDPAYFVEEIEAVRNGEHYGLKDIVLAIMQGKDHNIKNSLNKVVDFGPGYLLVEQRDQLSEILFDTKIEIEKKHDEEDNFYVNNLGNYVKTALEREDYSLNELVNACIEHYKRESKISLKRYQMAINEMDDDIKHYVDAGLELEFITNEDVHKARASHNGIKRREEERESKLDEIEAHNIIDLRAKGYSVKVDKKLALRLKEKGLVTKDEIHAAIRNNFKYHVANGPDMILRRGEDCLPSSLYEEFREKAQILGFDVPEKRDCEPINMKIRRDLKVGLKKEMYSKDDLIYSALIFLKNKNGNGLKKDNTKPENLSEFIETPENEYCYNFANGKKMVEERGFFCLPDELYKEFFEKSKMLGYHVPMPRVNMTGFNKIKLAIGDGLLDGMYSKDDLIYSGLIFLRNRVGEE